MDPIADHARRLENLIRSGTISAIDYGKAGSSPPRVRVKSGGLETDWLPWGALRAGKTRKWSPAYLGEQVGLIAPDGDTTKAMLLPGGFYQDSHDAPSIARTRKSPCIRTRPAKNTTTKKVNTASSCPTARVSFLWWATPPWKSGATVSP